VEGGSLLAARAPGNATVAWLKEGLFTLPPAAQGLIMPIPLTRRIDLMPAGRPRDMRLA
jgi:hypothetical protein